MSDESDDIPAGLGASGRALWVDTTERFVLDQPERATLLAACRTADHLDRLDEAVRHDGVTVVGPQGERAHPGLVEHRQQAVAFARLVASLRVPEQAQQQADDGDAPRRPQRRGGPRRDGSGYRLSAVAAS